MIKYFLILYRCLALNIITFIIDDMGYADLHAFNTPTIKKLSTEGIILKDHNTAITCTPSRASFLTGKYPANTGLTSALLYANPYGLSGHTTLPQVLGENGFNTSLVGKWHLGHAKTEYLPTSNGFNHFYGTHNAASDHYSKNLNGFNDLHNMEQPEIDKSHTTDLFTKKAIEVIKENKNNNLFLTISYQALHTPLQSPEYWVKKCEYITNYYRRIYCGMLLHIDYSISNILEELSWDDTFILFTSDNGGQPWFGALNYPLKGTKNSLYEGGNKGVAFIAGGLVKTSHVYEGMIHISDWFPTLLHLANIENIYDTDGIDLFNNIINNEESSRTEMLLHYDTYSHSISYRWKNYKLLIGRTGDSSTYTEYDNYECPINERYVDVITCMAMTAPINGDFIYNEFIRELRLAYNGDSIGSDILFGIDTFNDNIEFYDLNDGENVNIKEDKHFETVMNKVRNLNITHKQYKWFVKDGNVKYKEHKGEYFHSPWVVDEKNINEQNFIRYRALNIIYDMLPIREVFIIVLLFFMLKCQ